MLQWSEEVPVSSGISYNNENLISEFLRNQSSFESSPHISFFTSGDLGGIEPLAIHSVALMDSILTNNVLVEWIDIGANCNFKFLGNSLHACLTSIWSRQNNIILNENERRLVQSKWHFDTPKECFELNLSPMLKRIDLECLILFFDMTRFGIEDTQKVLKVIELFLLLINKKFKVSLRPIVIASKKFRRIFPKNLFREYCFKLPSKKHEFLNAHYLFVSKKTSINKSIDENFQKTLNENEIKILSGLIELDRPALKTASDLILNYSESDTSNLESLARKGFVSPLRHGGQKISHFADSMTQSVKRGIEHYCSDTAIKIVDFVPLLELNDPNYTFDELEKFISHRERILECLSLGMSSELSQSKKYFDACKEALTDKTCLNWIHNSSYMKNLLVYVSQAIISGNSTNIEALFNCFESLSFSFSDFFGNSQVPSNSQFLPSRVMTNLVYVFDNSNLKNTNIANRKRYFEIAAIHLEDVHFIEPFEKARVSYWKGWQLLDAGNKELAYKAFVDGAKEALEARYNVFDETTQKNIVTELSMFSLLIGKALDHQLKKHLLEHFWQYAPSHLFEELSVLVSTPSVKTLSYLKSGDYPKVKVVSSIFDVHVAVLIAGTLFKKYKLNIDLVIDSTRKDSVHRVPLDLLDEEFKFNIVVGGPSAPGHIGDLVSSLDPNICKLFQLKLGENFSCAIENLGDYSNIHVVSGCGIIENYNAWSKLARVIIPKLDNQKLRSENNMYETFLLSFLKRSGTKLAENVVDVIVAKVKDKVGESSKGKDEEIKQALLIHGKSNSSVSIESLPLPAAALSSLGELSDQKNVSKIYSDAYRKSHGELDMEGLKDYIDGGISCSHAVLDVLATSKKSKAIKHAKSHYEAFLNFSSRIEEIELSPDGVSTWDKELNKLNGDLFTRIVAFSTFLESL